MAPNPARRWIDHDPILKPPASSSSNTPSVDETSRKLAQLKIKSEDHDPNSLLQVHPVPSFTGDGLDGILVKVQPPRAPELKAGRKHMPCDIVLSIDVSASMDAAAPVPAGPDDDQPPENTGLTVLDLVKHAALTIVETLDPGDRLGIVTFSTYTWTVQPLTPMTESNKKTTRDRINALVTKCSTNLWGGITDGLKLFKDENITESSASSGRLPALLVLTDGMPNHMCPAQGYVPKLRTMQPLPASIHTFGFGYSLRSGLLKSIAEIGGGSYSFIPDAGMIGTVFVHAVANLQSTFASSVQLTLTYPSYLELQETTGEAVGKKPPADDGLIEGTKHRTNILTIPLNTLQYGQSRDIYLAYGAPWKAICAAAAEGPEPTLTATLTYSHSSTYRLSFTNKTPLPNKNYEVVARANPLAVHPTLDPAEAAYHVSRSAFISFLADLAPLDKVGEHKPLKNLPDDMKERLARLVATMPASRTEFAKDEDCRSLLIDIAGEEALDGIYFPPAGFAPDASGHRPGTPSTVSSDAPSNEDVPSSWEEVSANSPDSDSDSDNSPPTPTSTTASIRTVLSTTSTATSSLSTPPSQDKPWITHSLVATWSSGTGQVALALLNPNYYTRWGQHYLPSLASAHARQACNSFKDAGPLRYGRDSPLFVACRDALDAAFYTLPPPQPTFRFTDDDDWPISGAAYNNLVSMSVYNTPRGYCFAGCTGVLVVDGDGGQKWMRIGRLRKGMELVTPRGVRKVRRVVRTEVSREEMCLVVPAAAAAAAAVGGLPGKKGGFTAGSSNHHHLPGGGMVLVTPWHPIRLVTSAPRLDGEWVFPNEVSVRTVRYTGAMYSVQLERDDDAEAHAMLLGGGVWGLTLGHGITTDTATAAAAEERRDVRVHDFFGDYDKVSAALERLPQREGGLVLAGGVERDAKTGRARGFRRMPVKPVKPGKGRRSAKFSVRRKVVFRP